MKTTNLFASLLSALAFISSTQAVTIDMVTVGNPGNAPDTRYDATGFGSVGYNYQIGKYEVTAGQYTEFLNAVAKNDPNGLYNTENTGWFGGNIQRTGSSPNYSYSVASDWADRPANNLSFWDAARFANWLHNGQPTGAQGPGTTEDGAYHDVGDQALFGRNAGARFFIPTEDEWYKAAYYDPNYGGLGIGGYWEYPTGTDAVPGNDITEATNPGNNANFDLGGQTIGSPYYRTEVGEFEWSDSPYGTFDQGGNVREWNETEVYGWSRVVRGGSYIYNSEHLRAYSRADGNGPTGEHNMLGFRVASIPEPASIMLCLAGVLMLMLRRGRK
ncbi:MAG: SUMF1/EgtB/PvdO family nonheme iron enzyme [Pirellulales bacterium]|nr:SUMF1/EgtB/PvdO family nonheme iron enzyme [Pirellulales bacterium]